MSEPSAAGSSRAASGGGHHHAATREESILGANRKRSHMVRLYFTAILLLSMMFTLYVWQSTKMVEVKLRLQHTEKTISTLNTNNASLRAKISKLQSLGRIEKVARDDLGMVVPKRMCYIPVPANLLKP